VISQELDFAGVCAKLKELAGERVNLEISGVEEEPPLLAFAEEGVLSGPEKPGWSRQIRRILGYHRKVRQIEVGSVSLLLHPDHLVGATWIEGDPGPGQVRQLTMVFGHIEVEIRIGPF